MSIIVKEGYPIIKLLICAAAACYVIGRYFHISWLLVIAVLALVLALFSCYFFRNPSRTINATPQDILSPADGTVMEVVTKYDETRGCVVQVVRIFLSIFNVHVQRAPITGAIEDIQYKKGLFLPAMNKRAHIENEQNTVLFTNPDGKKILCTQIAGLIARRIVMWKHQGDVLKQGDLYGMIKFGSQVDVYMPAETDVLVQPKQKVRSGITRIARW